METNDAPKSHRGRKPSKWQLTPCKTGVDDGVHTIFYDDDRGLLFVEKKAKAALAYARAFDYIPNDPTGLRLVRLR